GTTIQGESHKHFNTILQARLQVGSVYKVTRFGLRSPRKNFRTTTFPHCLDLTPTTHFELQLPTIPPFLEDSFQYIEFEEFRDHEHPPCSYLTG
ncbi:hypothetical protein LINPERPRIM_LOCUS9675, partial [Linum perenne]